MSAIRIDPLCSAIYQPPSGPPLACLLENDHAGQHEHMFKGSGIKWDNTTSDTVNHPKHYNDHPSGVECIVIVEHMTFNIGNAVKYLWRAGLKSTDALVDLQKALWYTQREIKRLSKGR